MFPQNIISDILEKSLMTLDFKNEPQTLYEPVGYMLGIGGKHLRPRLCLTAFNLFSDDITDAVVYPAMALEMFHQFTLVHDDIMDRSDTRRNQPTVHVKWDDNTAILSGDTMSLIAYRLLSHCPKESLQPALKLFTDTAIGVCEGQRKDMDFENMPLITMDEYMDMIGLKTGVLLACSAAMGAVLAGAPEEKAKGLYEFGYQTGLAFQIADDFLDTFGDRKLFGKPIGGDIANNKKTWLLVECLHRAKAAGRKEELNALLALGENERERKVEAVRQMYVDLGVRDDAEAAILACHSKAVRALEEAGFDGDQTETMKSFAEQLLHREK